jgi:hypothetical protein
MMKRVVFLLFLLAVCASTQVSAFAPKAGAVGKNNKAVKAPAKVAAAKK